MTAQVGRSAPRKEGPKKVTGQARYIDDLQFEGVIHGTTVRSQIPRGRIKKIHFEGTIPWSEFTIVTAKDIGTATGGTIPGKNYVALILQDQPYLADEVINHPEEAVVLLAHPDKYLLEEARKCVRIETEALPHCLSIDDALAKKPVIWGTDNVFKSYEVRKGDIASVWAKADQIIEGEYFTGAQEQLYIENNGMVAVANPKDGVTVWGSMQCPYYVHKALLPLFDLAPEKVRIIQAETGGGFGGKEEYPSMLAGHAAMLAWKSGKPVKMLYDRAEDMVATTKRHPSRTRHKTAVSKDGKILGMEIDFVIDGGAYATLSAVVLSRGTIHAAGPYNIPHVAIHSQAVATNHPPHGAFRGFGAPQSIFALERHMDKIAKVLGITPEELRRRNFVKPGELTATSQVVRDPIDMGALLTRALKESDYHAKRARFEEQNKKPGSIKRGWALRLSCTAQGLRDRGEKYLASVVGVEATHGGKVRVLAASTEIGQGTNTIFAQIASDALGIDYDAVDVLAPDTKFVPNSGPTVASRTVMVVGKLVENASRGLAQMLRDAGLLKESYTTAEFQKACFAYREKFGELKAYATYKQPSYINWDDEKYQGDAYGAYAWAVYVAEVSVDTTTYEVRVDDFVALQEIGKVVHPIFAAGQIEGGVAQGIGYAIYEKVIWKDGRMANNRMTNYIVPTAADTPPIRVFFEEHPYENGPSGAKGIGELPMDGPAPAILNAVEMATGKAVNAIPLLPEDMMSWMQGEKS